MAGSLGDDYDDDDDISNQSFSCHVFSSILLCLFLCIMLDAERVLLVVKCSCSPAIYDTYHIRS